MVASAWLLAVVALCWSTAPLHAAWLPSEEACRSAAAAINAARDIDFPSNAAAVCAPEAEAAAILAPATKTATPECAWGP